MSQIVKLKSSDDVSFDVDRPVACLMGIVEKFLEEATSEDITMPLPNVSSRQLVKIIPYLKKVSELKAKAEEGGERDLQEYNTAFMKSMSEKDLCEIMVAVNYLDIKVMLGIVCDEIADRIKNKSVEYVRDMFNIENDYTPEEEAALRQGNSWAFEGVDED